MKFLVDFQGAEFTEAMLRLSLAAGRDCVARSDIADTVEIDGETVRVIRIAPRRPVQRANVVQFPVRRVTDFQPMPPAA